MPCHEGRSLDSGLIGDAAGNLYDETEQGGVHCRQVVYGCGTVFELSPHKTRASGWRETQL
jgi:hypothetical protein